MLQRRMRLRCAGNPEEEMRNSAASCAVVGLKGDLGSFRSILMSDVNKGCCVVARVFNAIGVVYAGTESGWHPLGLDVQVNQLMEC